MAIITIVIPDEKMDSIVNAVAEVYGYGGDGTKIEFMNNTIFSFIAKAYKRNELTTQVGQIESDANVYTSDITVNIA